MPSSIRSVYNKGLLYSWFVAMHTRIDLLLYGKPEEELRRMIAIVSDALHQLETVANFFDPSSELAQLNAIAHLDPVPVSPALFRMLSLSRIYHDQTGGCFDIAIRSDNYHSDTFRSVLLDDAHRTVYFARPGIRLDLSGFVKGYALDQIKEILQHHGISNALVNIGNSSIMALGNHPNGEGWKITVASTGEEYHLKNECLTTSGNETSERKHIICPQTGKYMEGQGMVSVVTAGGAEGEAWATAAFIGNMSLIR